MVARILLTLGLLAHVSIAFGQQWFEQKKRNIRGNLENMPVSIALIEIQLNSANPPRVLQAPSHKAGDTILKFADGASENLDMKLNKKFFRSDDPVPYITSLVNANIFAMPEQHEGKGTTFYLRSRGCLTEKKYFPTLKFADLKSDIRRFLTTMRNVMGYDGVVVEHSGNNFIVGLIDGASLKVGMQGSAILDSASELILKRSESQAQSLFHVLEKNQNYALVKALVGTKLPKIGTKVVFDQQQQQLLSH